MLTLEGLTSTWHETALFDLRELGEPSRIVRRGPPTRRPFLLRCRRGLAYTGRIAVLGVDRRSGLLTPGLVQAPAALAETPIAE